VPAASQLNYQDVSGVFRLYEEGSRLLQEAVRLQEMTIEELYDYIKRSRSFQQAVDDIYEALDGIKAKQEEAQQAEG